MDVLLRDKKWLIVQKIFWTKFAVQPYKEAFIISLDNNSQLDCKNLENKTI